PLEARRRRALLGTGDVPGLAVDLDALARDAPDDRDRRRLLLRAPRTDRERIVIGVDDQRRVRELGGTQVAQPATLALVRVRSGVALRGQRPHEVLEALDALRTAGARLERVGECRR